MKVYVVVNYYDETVDAVFSSRVKASLFIEKSYHLLDIPHVGVEEFTLDAKEKDNEARIRS